MQVVPYSEAQARRFNGGTGSMRTPFFTSSAATPDRPVAFLSKGHPGRVIRPHFHVVDQFQLIVAGKGRLGRHPVAPYSVHFSRALTPYGPLVGDDETGISFLTLRSRFDPGAQYFPESKQKLAAYPDRKPWQISHHIDFSLPEAKAPGEINLQDIPGIRDERGLGAYSITMGPNSRTAAPDPSCGDGQYLIIVDGSLMHENVEHKALTIVFIEPRDGAFPLCAGPVGLKAAILNFPRVAEKSLAAALPAAGEGFKQWQCLLCGFFYDEEQGMPEEGIPPGTRWADVPDTWSCPDCSVSKSDFRMIEL